MIRDAAVIEPVTGVGLAGVVGAGIWGAVTAGWVWAVTSVESLPDTWITVVGSVVAGGGLLKLLQYLGKWYDNRREKNNKDNRQQRKDAIDEYKSVIDGLREDRESDRKLIHDLRNDFQGVNMRLAVCEHERAELTKRVEALEREGPHD